MQHISGYDLIQGAIGCSGAYPFDVAKSGMKRDYMCNTVSRRNARGALSTSPRPSMLCKKNNLLERKKRNEKERKNKGTGRG